MTRFDGFRLAKGPYRLAHGLCALCLGLVLASTFASPALSREQDDEKEEQLFRIERIEISTFGSWVGGATYLDLPAPLTPLTNDTGATDILDFSGLVPDPRVIAPHKEIDSGWQAGANTTFYLTPNFGLTLAGSYGKADAVFTGQRVLLEPDPLDPIFGDPIEVPQARSEIDRSTMTTWTGDAGIIYHIMAERKHNTRPFVTLGIGGILNQFDNTDDVSALTWNMGAGVGFPVAGSFRGFVSAGLRIFVWKTEEVSLNETLVLPELTAGLTWRYMVPEEEALPEDDVILPGQDAADAAPEEPGTTAGEGGLRL